MRTPNHPAAGKAEIALLFSIVHHRLGLPEPARSMRNGEKTPDAIFQ
jgi:hypothetical protein